MAEAAVLEAKYRALQKNKDIYLAEINRDIAQTLYQNMKDFNIQMPQNYVNSGSGSEAGKMTSNLDVITAFAALSTMNAAVQRVNSAQKKQK